MCSWIAYLVWTADVSLEDEEVDEFHPNRYSLVSHGVWTFIIRKALKVHNRYSSWGWCAVYTRYSAFQLFPNLVVFLFMWIILSPHKGYVFWFYLIDRLGFDETGAIMRSEQDLKSKRHGVKQHCRGYSSQATLWLAPWSRASLISLHYAYHN